MNKKIIIAISCAGLALLLCLAGGVPAFWYLFLRNDPHEALKNADKYIDETGDYYEYESNTDIDMSLINAKFETSVKVDVEGKVDVQNKKTYFKTISTTEGKTEIKETYVIDDTTYEKVGKGGFEKVDKKEEDNTEKQLNEMIDTMIDEKEYEVTEEEVEGYECFRYKLSFSEKQKEVINKWFETLFSEDIEESDSFKVDKIDFESGEINFWVSKNEHYPIKLDMKIENIEMDIETEGINFIMIMNMESKQVYKNFGEEVSIDSPV